MPSQLACSVKKKMTQTQTWMEQHTHISTKERKREEKDQTPLSWKRIKKL